MKKRLSLLLAIAMVFSMFSSMAFANTSSDGQTLQELGILKGNSDGDLMEDADWTKENLMVLLSRLYGAEADAEATEKAHTFTDVTDPYYDGFITWAVEQGLITGVNETTFGYGSTVDKLTFYAIILRVLGYDTTGENFNNAGEMAIEAGLAAEGTDFSETATRGETYSSVVKALYTEVEEGVTLGAQLGLDGFVPEEPEELEVVDVYADNLKQVVVEFNMDVEDNSDVTDVDNYSIEDLEIEDADCRMET